MRCTTLLALCALIVPASASAQDFTAVASFDNVRGSSSGHCYGWSLALWRYKGRLLGLLDRHQGLCGDPPCRTLADVSHDAKTGRLTFSAFGMPFNGTLRRNEVIGKLGDERLRLKRRTDRMDARSDQTLDAWCDFWRTVPRCKGVAELCSSLRAAKQ